MIITINEFASTEMKCKCGKLTVRHVKGNLETHDFGHFGSQTVLKTKYSIDGEYSVSKIGRVHCGECGSAPAVRS